MVVADLPRRDTRTGLSVAGRNLAMAEGRSFVPAMAQPQPQPMVTRPQRIGTATQAPQDAVQSQTQLLPANQVFEPRRAAAQAAASKAAKIVSFREGHEVVPQQKWYQQQLLLHKQARNAAAAKQREVEEREKAAKKIAEHIEERGWRLQQYYHSIAETQAPGVYSRGVISRRQTEEWEEEAERRWMELEFNRAFASSPGSSSRTAVSVGPVHFVNPPSPEWTPTSSVDTSSVVQAPGPELTPSVIGEAREHIASVPHQFSSGEVLNVMRGIQKYKGTRSTPVTSNESAGDRSDGGDTVYWSANESF